MRILLRGFSLTLSTLERRLGTNTVAIDAAGGYWSEEFPLVEGFRLLLVYGMHGSLSVSAE